MCGERDLDMDVLVVGFIVVAMLMYKAVEGIATNAT